MSDRSHTRDFSPEPAKVRPSAVAGRFYPDDPQELSQEVDACLASSSTSEKDKFAAAIGCVVPHAGYMYSGHVAGAVYGMLPARARYVVLGPNHWGRGAPLAIMPAGKWATPLGQIPIDSELAAALQAELHLLTDDADAHSVEHSLEVQLPFLQRLQQDASFVPIAIGAVDYHTLELLGHALAYVLRSLKQSVLIVASSDMNHYEPDVVTRKKDQQAVDRILALDPVGLWDVLHHKSISMCGSGPTVAMLTAAKDLGAKRGALIKYATSADAGGELDSVVGYAGIVVL